ncbi:hypothetical protein P8C59_008573 [Phyllachora maydis]|uniref:Uncharacterized protein n=1 Tax=Phyllachora maydis TaxID=1825666 RepID=A0AAD9IC17_9PEZI|nr:hypothetical protein P8C59_008573 [Phyllachora maydis]
MIFEDICAGRGNRKALSCGFYVKCRYKQEHHGEERKSHGHKEQQPAAQEEYAAMEDVTKASKEQPARDESMDIDSAPKGLSQKQQARRKIEKRKAKKSSIVFPKYGERRSSRKKR